MIDLYAGLTEQEIQDRTRPFFFLQVGDVFTFNGAPYMRIGRIPVAGMDAFPIEYNAVGLAYGVPVVFSNDTMIIELDNPYK